MLWSICRPTDGASQINAVSFKTIVKDDSFRICWWSLLPKTRVSGLAVSEDGIMLCSFVLTQYQRVTDRLTDRQKCRELIQRSSLLRVVKHWTARTRYTTHIYNDEEKLADKNVCCECEMSSTWAALDLASSWSRQTKQWGNRSVSSRDVDETIDNQTSQCMR